MKRIALPVALGALTSCVAPVAPPPRPVPPPVARPAPLVRPAPPPVATPPSRPILAGSWSWQPAPSRARFIGSDGAQRLSLTCDRATVVLRLARATASPAPAVTLRASTTARTITGEAEGSDARVRLAPRDPLLDALAFSRGRFAIAIDGVETSFPPWPEVARVIEDCRSPPA